MNDLVRFEEPRQLTAADIRAQVNLVQEVMKAVMQGPSKEHPEGIHYGVIPGTPKPTLYKPGAEKLAQAFRIAVSYEVVDLSTPEFIRYRVTATGTHQTSGTVMGAGMGECSTGEEKYKWRKAYDEEFKATPDDRKRIKYGKYTTKQVRTEPADLANTILKMACKRAQVAMILNVTAASDLFTQDIEDLPEELRSTEEQSAQPVQQPKSKTAKPAAQPEEQKADPGPMDDKPILPAQLKILRANLEQAALTDVDMIAKFGPIENMKFSQFAAIQDWVRNPAA